MGRRNKEWEDWNLNFDKRKHINIIFVYPKKKNNNLSMIDIILTCFNFLTKPTSSSGLQLKYDYFLKHNHL